MSSFDIKQLARELVARNTHLSAREVIVTRFLETAVEIVNSPWRKEPLLSNLSSVYELDYGLINVDEQILELVEIITTNNRKRRWDERIKIKIEERKVGRNFHHIHVLMDLDATLAEALEEDSVYRKSMEMETCIGDVVIDTPDMDLINELDRVLLSELTPRAKVLSDRLGKFITDDSRGSSQLRSWKTT